MPVPFTQPTFVENDMSEQAMEQSDDDGFTYEVSDEALEAAGGMNEERGPSTYGPTFGRPGCC